MNLLTKALSSVGLMTVKEHEALNDLYHRMAKERNDALILEAEATAKFKKAVTDLSAAVRERDDLINGKQAFIDAIGELNAENDGLLREIEQLTPDALKWRDYLKRSRDRKAAKKEGV